jgi:Capsule assembly protein Wzi
MLAAFMLWIPQGAAAFVSASIPLHSPAYDGLERLEVLGLLPEAMLSTKPLNRLEVARWLIGIEASATEDPLVHQLLDELEEEFKPEMDDLRENAAPPPVRYRLADPFRLELSGAALENQTFRFRENHQGDFYRDGPNAQLELNSWMTLGRYWAAEIEPSVTSREGGTDLVLKKAEVKLTVSNLEIEVGRDSAWWGPGDHGALLVSDNAQPFNFFKLGSAEAFRVPWPLSFLGLWKVTLFLARLEKDRDFPYTKLLGLHFELKPVSFIELGATRMTLFGGQGRPALSLKDFFEIYFGKPNQPGRHQVDERASVDLRLRIPRLDPFLTPLELYAEVGGEDEAGYHFTKDAYLMGMYLPDLLHLGTTDFRAEYANDHVAGYPNLWYSGGIYTSGYTDHGEIIGHHMGTDSGDLFLRLTHLLSPRLRWGLQWEEERHGLSTQPPRPKFQRIGTDLAYRPSPSWRLSGRYEYERVSTIDRVSGTRSHNHLVEIQLELRF